MQMLEVVGGLIVAGVIGIGVYRAILFVTTRLEAPAASVKQPKRRR